MPELCSPPQQCLVPAKRVPDEPEPRTVDVPSELSSSMNQQFSQDISLIINPCIADDTIHPRNHAVAAGVHRGGVGCMLLRVTYLGWGIVRQVEAEADNHHLW